MRALLLISVLLLGACKPASVPWREQEPYPVDVDAKCLQDCPQLPKLEADQPDGSAPVDALGDEQPSIAEQYEACNIQHRKACADVLERLVEKAVIVITAPK